MKFNSLLRKIALLGPAPEVREHTEISEKRTTKLGYFLLIIMVIVGVWQGQTFIDELSRTIPSPAPLSYCIAQMSSAADVNGYYNPSYNTNYIIGDTSATNCNFNKNEVDAGVPAIWKTFEDLNTEARVRGTEYSTAESAKSRLEQQLRDAQSNYAGALTEKMANEQGVVYNKTDLQQQIPALRAQVDAMNGDVAARSAIATEAQEKVTAYARANKATIDKAYDAQYNDSARVELLRALLEFLFITPLLWFTLRRYVRAQDVGATTGIIWAAVVTIFALLFAQVMAVFIYEVIPHRLVEVLIAFFAKWDFALTILQYVLLVATPAIFGFIVYQIQKRVFSERAMFLRALKSGKCPRCSMEIKDGMNFCPVCGFQMKEPCASGGHERLVGLDHCEVCGVGREVKTPA